MGTTIGINTSILFASLFFIASKLNLKGLNYRVLAKKGLISYNICLLLFWCTLLIAGVKKSHWMYFTKDILFTEMQESLYYIYISFFICGLGLVTSILIITIPLLKNFIKHLRLKTTV